MSIYFCPVSLPDGVSIRARSPLTQGQPNKRVTHFPSVKNQSIVACETMHLAQFCLHLEFEPKVLLYTARPFAIRFQEDALTAFPHFAAILRDGRTVYYHVSTTEPTHSRLLQRLALTRECFGKADLIFEQVNPVQYQSLASTSNLRALYHQAFGVSAIHTDAIQKMLESSGPLTIKSLLERRFAVEDIAFAIFFQHVEADLLPPISLSTVVRGI